MIDSSPRPLPQHRLEKLVYGLRTRRDGSLQRTAAEIESLNHSIGEHETEYQAQDTQLQLEYAQQREATLTNWDEEIHECWNHAELRSYRAIYETAEREGSLRKIARQQIEQATAEAKKRIAEIERRFLQAKDVPLKRLKTFRANKEAVWEELRNVEGTADAALAQRSIRPPKADVDELPLEKPAHSDAALEQMQLALASARHHCDRLTNNAIAKFFDSVWWWGLCGLVFVGSALGLILTEILPPLPSVLAGAGSTVVMLLLGFLGIRPWLKRSAASEYPRVKNYVALGGRLNAAADELAIAENDSELKRLAARRDDRFEQAKAWRDQQVVEVTRKLDVSLKELRASAAQEKELARTGLTRGLGQTVNRYEERLATEQAASQGDRNGLKAALDEQCGALRQKMERLHRGGALRLQIATQKALQVITRCRRWCAEQFPPWERLQDGAHGHWPETLGEPVLPLGSLPVGPILTDNAKLDVGETQLQAPLLFSPLQDEYLTITGDPNLPAVQQLVRNLVMRALTTLPAGKTQVCVIDPPGLGRDFGWLMHLNDFDPQLVSHRVWTQPGHIAKQISSLAMAAEDFIQQSLRNRYQNIVQYNRDAGALAEPFRILVWSSLPSGLDDESWKNLQSVLDTGARCGIIPILVLDPNLSWPYADQRDWITRRGFHLTLQEDGQTFVATSRSFQDLPIQTHDSASDEQSQKIVHEVGRRALLSQRVEVPLEQMLPGAEERWQGDSSMSLEIPIGQSGVGRMHSMRLGLGTAQHAIVAGKTGSGKSSLLHALITSAALKYGPDRLRVVLLDFKKGVEFQVYSDAGLPHADIIGIESHREFGLSALEYVDGCMQRRGEAFRAAGVQDIASWNALHPDAPMPRMLIVIDEFQELFVEDDKLSGQASLILDRIVRQGRSFGVHAVLSSQTLAGAYSLPRTTLGQMAVRIALQCDPSDAQIIFAEDNPAAARLKHPGQAVYNDAGGRIEGNQPMQIGWLPKQKQVEWFGEMDSGYQNDDPTTNRLGRTVVYDGNRAASWNSNNANLAIDLAHKEINPAAIWCVAGESVAINPAVAFPLTRQAGRNVLLVGADDAQAAAVMQVVNTSLVRAANRLSQRTGLFVVQGAKPTDAKALGLPQVLQELDCDLKTGDIRDTESVLAEVYECLQQRMQDESGEGEQAPVLLNLIQLGRLRDLRRDDDFANFGESSMTPDKQLEEILRDGPSYGVHTLMWAESYSTVNRWLSRTALREIEIRLLMQMSGNDSTNLVDSVAASRLGEHVMLLYDEATGQEQRFRPFAPDTLDELNEWAKSVDSTS